MYCECIPHVFEENRLFATTGARKFGTSISGVEYFHCYFFINCGLGGQFSGSFEPKFNTDSNHVTADIPILLQTTHKK